MCKLQIIRHGDVSIQDILDIIDIKSLAWPYDADSQFRWIIKNLQENDMHFILRKEDSAEIVAYLNLVEVEAVFEDGHTLCYGVGNVCSRVRGIGLGRSIMESVNRFLTDSHEIGILLCKDALVPFYRKMGWSSIPNSIESLKGINVLTYRQPTISSLLSLGRIF